jgi:hypothetical protein
MRKMLVAVAVLMSLASVAGAEGRTYRIQINGRPLSERDRQIVQRLEMQSGQPAPDGSFWYDNATGVLGLWGGPGIGVLPAGLGLGGALPANASGGGHGRLTGVFINGREIHPQDYRFLSELVGQPIMPGRYWADARGYAGLEGGPPLVNLAQLAAARASSHGPYYRNKGKGESTFVGQGCAAVHGKLGSGESEQKYSYYVGC